MPTIDEFSDQPRHSIKAVHELTGVRPVTLRAWERRYKLLNPRRTSGNYRLYSERDVALLRWLKGRVDSGLPIRSAAAELRELRRVGLWPEIAPALPQPAGSGAASRPPGDFARRLYDALVAHDEAAAGVVLGEAHAVFDLATVCQAVITPCLVEIGDAWQMGRLRIATEHFASTYVRGRMLALFQSYPSRSGAPRIIVGCAPGELHEIGPLMLALLVRQAGYRVEYLGADVYLDDLFFYARSERPAAICLSAGSEQPARALAGVQAGLARLRPRPRFGFGGRAFDLQPELRDLVPGVFLGESLDQALRSLQSMVPL